jgi:non-ribosomal peptide synthetase component E (peptide arylation enzyme)
MKKRVPNYLVPGRIVELEEMPVSSSSGKVDRKVLTRILEDSRTQ